MKKSKAERRRKRVALRERKGLKRRTLLRERALAHQALREEVRAKLGSWGRRNVSNRKIDAALKRANNDPARAAKLLY